MSNWTKKATIATLGLLGLLATSMPNASPAAAASAQVSLEGRVLQQASLVVDGTVVGVETILIDGNPHRVAEVAVESSLKGTADSTIRIVTIGGDRPDGTVVVATHTPIFSTGDQIQVGLSPARDELVSSIGGDSPLYEPSHGEQGVHWNYQAEPKGGLLAASDYLLNGFKIGDFPTSYRINASGSGVASSSTIGAIRSAADLLNADPGSDIALAYDGTTSKSGFVLDDGQNTVSFVSSGLPDSTVGLAQMAVNPTTKTIVEFDIAFNTKFTFGVGSGTGNWMDITAIAMHEFGHTLGLDHTSAFPPSGQLMHWVIPAKTQKRLGDGDRAGLKLLYPAPPSQGPTCNGFEVTIDMRTGVPGYGTPQRDVILGTDDRDVIVGGGGNDVICSGGATDRVWGGDGADYIDGGGGSDFIYAGDGDDTVRGDSGADRIYGGNGDDQLFGMGGQDFMWGEAGNDVMQGNWQTDHMYGGDGNDELYGAGGKDRLYGENGNDELYGGLNTDYLNGGNGDDLGDGQRGKDNPLVRGTSGCELVETRRSC